MKHTLLLAAICIGLILCAVGYSDSQYSTALGRQAPDFYVDNGNGRVSPASLRGQYALLNFWSSTDAPSRTSANIYTAWHRKNPDKQLKLVSVNFDDSENLFREIVRLDSLIPAQQYHAGGDTARAISNNYGLDEGMGSLLIGPDGRILAHNPTAEELDNILANH